MEIHEHNLEGVINLSTAMKKEEKAMKNSLTNGDPDHRGASPSQVNKLQYVIQIYI